MYKCHLCRKLINIHEKNKSLERCQLAISYADVEQRDIYDVIQKYMKHSGQLTYHLSVLARSYYWESSNLTNQNFTPFLWSNIGTTVPFSLASLGSFTDMRIIMLL